MVSIRWSGNEVFAAGIKCRRFYCAQRGRVLNGEQLFLGMFVNDRTGTFAPLKFRCLSAIFIFNECLPSVIGFSRGI